LAGAPLERLEDAGELALMRRLALYPRLIEAAALAHEPHRIAFYLYDLASDFHAQWNRGKDASYLRFIIQNDPQITMARLALVQGVVIVLASGLGLLGVEAADERGRWAPLSNQDYTPAPAAQNPPAASRYYDEPQVNAQSYGGYADDGGQEHQQDQHESQYYDQDDSALEPHDEAMYDDPPRVRRGSALPTALALIACAVVGTAGAYAFRSYYGTGGATQAPPVITADTANPTKIVPATDPRSGKGGQDRLASADKEQIIATQEEPVAL